MWVRVSRSPRIPSLTFPVSYDDAVTLPSPLEERSLAVNQKLRILPVGDSITWGYRSTDGNGYRLALLDRLIANDSSAVTYIGSQHSGNMTNNNNEGYPGLTIEQISSKVSASGSFHQQPNLVLLLAGTNDMNLNQNVSSAPERLGTLIDTILTACTNAVVVVGEITPIGNAPAEARVKAYNAAIPAIVAARVAKGKHVVAVNMSSVVSGSELIDGLHPTEEAYVKMAGPWYQGIEQVAASGWIEAPINVGVPTSSSKLTSHPTSSSSKATSRSSKATSSWSTVTASRSRATPSSSKAPTQNATQSV